MKNTKIVFNKKAGHPVVNLQDDQNIVLTTKEKGNYRSLKINPDDTKGFDATDGYFTNTIVKEGNTKTFLGFLTKKGKSRLLNFLKNE